MFAVAAVLKWWLKDADRPTVCKAGSCSHCGETTVVSTRPLPPSNEVSEDAADSDLHPAHPPAPPAPAVAFVEPPSCHTDEQGVVVWRGRTRRQMIKGALGYARGAAAAWHVQPDGEEANVALSSREVRLVKKTVCSLVSYSV